MKEKAICCFCGDSVTIETAVALSIKPNHISKEEQGFFGHKECLKFALDESMVKYLHPEI
ncbi:hypothetical protein [Winogradskyella sp.]|uniref:hypothetical protein n=1 Tax=Winogradskyella sp. TaxID=1883156 RepID=UPI002631C3CE|nr:hypothetical protein [Winogradskyella sp.]